MPRYELVLEPSRDEPAARIELIASDASAAFGWAERSGHGRRFEIFEDGRSLGRAELSGGANFWILSPHQLRDQKALPAVPSD